MSLTKQICYIIAKHKGMTPIKLDLSLFWDVTPCILVVGY